MKLTVRAHSCFLLGTFSTESNRSWQRIWFCRFATDIPTFLISRQALLSATAASASASATTCRGCCCFSCDVGATSTQYSYLNITDIHSDNLQKATRKNDNILKNYRLKRIECYSLDEDLDLNIE